MPIIDLLLAAYLGFGFRKGMARGPAHEAWKALNTLSGVAVGAGLYTLLSGTVSDLAKTQGLGGVGSFFVGFGGAFALLRVVRRKLQASLTEHLGEENRSLGGLLGLIRTGGWSLAGITTGVLSPVHDLFMNHSGVASLIGTILGVETGT